MGNEYKVPSTDAGLESAEADAVACKVRRETWGKAYDAVRLVAKRIGNDAAMRVYLALQDVSNADEAQCCGAAPQVDALWARLSAKSSHNPDTER